MISVEDDIDVDEAAEGGDEELLKTVLASKKKELDATEAFGIFDVCEELPKDAKNIFVFVTPMTADAPQVRIPQCKTQHNQMSKKFHSS